MNDTVYNNPYLTNRSFDLRNYTLNDFLYREIAVKRVTDTDRVVLAIGNILALLKFNIHYVGFRFLTVLAARYIVKSGFQTDKAIESIAQAYGTVPEFVKDSITDSILLNNAFVKNATKILGIPVVINNQNIIEDTLKIIAAIFIIHYNYYTVDETFASDFVRTLDFERGQ